MNPALPPRPDVSYVGAATPPPPPPERAHSMSKTPSRRDPPPLPPHPSAAAGGAGGGAVDGDWEAREELRVRELEEARARAAQMEKTMRWWSDCTANWREKWGKVRNERNKAREEARHLRGKLEVCVKESSTLKRERGELGGQLEGLRKQVEAYQTLEKERNSVCSSGSHKSDHDGPSSHSEPKEHAGGVGGEDFVSKLLSKKDRDVDSSSSRDSDKSEKRGSDTSRSEKRGGRARRSGDNSPAAPDAEARQRMAVLQLKLEESSKTLQAEREEKSRLVRSLEEQQGELSALRARFEGMKQDNDTMRSQVEKSEWAHRDELGRIASELEDESMSRSDMDKKLADLRKELERLQAENAVEWGKRERLETEKQALERDNKKLRAEVEHLQEEVERKARQATSVIDSDVRTLQFDLAERTKELAELKHAQHKMKKVLADKTAELDHAKSRADQYETEVRKLRTRIEELKRELAAAEDEVDQQSNQIRRLQRTNDELQETSENLQVQVEHLQTRLRRSASQPSLSTRASSLKSFNMNIDHESTDANTEDEDDEDDGEQGATD